MQTSPFQTTIHIAGDGSGDFATISEALALLREADSETAPVTLRIHKGVYKEQLTIDRPFLTLIGDSPEDTILTGNLYARMPSDDIGKLGTFRTYSCRIAANDVTLKNLTLENSAGRGPDVGQALALYADGDRLIFENCRFLGGQDTLFTAPLPPKEIEPNGFVGPGQHTPRINGRHYYKNCYLEGDIDFIFGGATAYFEDCECFSKDIGRTVNSYVTAASTPEGQDYGYVMNRCRFTGNCPPHSACLGRPWREYAQTVLLNCEIGAHICAKGWDDWNKPQAHETVFFAEFASTGPSLDMQKRPGWVHILTPAEAKQFSRQNVLGGTDGWNP
ncbi:MAG: pectinesterase family protein [Lachnospiraceae bacterium]|nr:pectinesterase family protein [Lachnospiraceae bacterium]